MRNWRHDVHGFVGLGLVLLLGACGGGSSGGDPYSSRVLEVGTDIAVADIDGDGRADVVTLTHVLPVEGNPQGRLTVYRQTAAGVFSAPESMTVGCYPWSLSLADIDGDGRTDLVVSDVQSSRCAEAPAGNAIHLLLQDPASPGRFLPSRVVLGNVHSARVAVGDFNGDGIPDIATGEGLAASRWLKILHQDPLRRGTFLPPVQIPLPDAASEVVAGDIDRDGRQDLLVGSGSSLSLLLQRQQGGFEAPMTLAQQVGLNVQRMVIADVNGDGSPDLLVHYSPQSTDARGKITVLLQGASSTAWAAPVDTSVADLDASHATAFGDLDGNGRPDVVLAGSFPTGSAPLSPPSIRSEVNLLMQSTPGGFRLRSTVAVAQQIDQVTVADLDGDGRNDILLFDGSGAVTVMLQSRTSPGSFRDPQPLR